jgi:hypothetical protein
MGVVIMHSIRTVALGILAIVAVLHWTVVAGSHASDAAGRYLPRQLRNAPSPPLSPSLAVVRDRARTMAPKVRRPTVIRLTRAPTKKPHKKEADEADAFQGGNSSSLGGGGRDWEQWVNQWENVTIPKGTNAGNASNTTSGPKPNNATNSGNGGTTNSSTPLVSVDLPATGSGEADPIIPEDQAPFHDDAPRPTNRTHGATPPKPRDINHGNEPTPNNNATFVSAANGTDPQDRSNDALSQASSGSSVLLIVVVVSSLAILLPIFLIVMYRRRRTGDRKTGGEDSSSSSKQNKTLSSGGSQDQDDTGADDDSSGPKIDVEVTSNPPPPVLNETKVKDPFPLEESTTPFWYDPPILESPTANATMASAVETTISRLFAVATGGTFTGRLRRSRSCSSLGSEGSDSIQRSELEISFPDPDHYPRVRAVRSGSISSHESGSAHTDLYTRTAEDCASISGPDFPAHVGGDGFDASICSNDGTSSLGAYIRSLRYRCTELGLANNAQAGNGLTNDSPDGVFRSNQAPADATGALNSTSVGTFNITQWRQLTDSSADKNHSGAPGRRGRSNKRRPRKTADLNDDEDQLVLVADYYFDPEQQQ